MDFLSVKEVAQHFGYTQQYIRKLIRDNRIPAERVADSWLIPSDVLEEGILNDKLEKKEQANSDFIVNMNHKPKHIALSFFTGAMGLDLGIEKAGFEVVFASEIDPDIRSTIHANKPEIASIGDIRNYTAKEIRELCKLNDKDEIDLIVGGPPCQAFSTAGKRMGFEDERGNVFLTYLQMIVDLRPKYAVIENVRGLLSAPLKHRPHNQRVEGNPPLENDEQQGGALSSIVNFLEKNGYGVSFNLYNAANFGAPQKRERVVIICSRDGKKPPYLEPTHSENGEFGLPKWKTVKEALKGLEKIEHHFIKFPEKRLKYYRMLKPGQYWKHLPENLQKEALGASYYAGGGKTGFLRRLDWDKPSPTLVTNPAMPATDLAHPSEDRPLSIEEYKRIQQFPDSWILEGSLLSQYKQVGNAVPGSLGLAVGSLIMKLLQGKEVNVYEGFNYSRYKNTDDISWKRMIRSSYNDMNLRLF